MSGTSWKYTRRPGGWIVAERKTSTGVERIRMAVQLQGDRYWAQVDGQSWFGVLSSEEAAGSGGAARSDADLTAQFPGKVRKVMVTVGATVAEGDSLVLVEAMKMEFPVRAPYAGRVKKVHVQDGQQIGPGDRFVDLEKVE